MTTKAMQWLGLLAGLALIAVYSIIMIASDGAGGWAALLLVAGIAVLVGTGIASKRGTSDN
jgi:hypothetical protein